MQAFSRSLLSRFRLPPAQATLATALTAAILLPIWFRLVDRYERGQRLEFRAQVREYAATHAAGIAAAVNRRLTLIDGLYAFVDSRLDSKDFYLDLKPFAAGLHTAARGIRAIEVIPGGVIRFVYPLEGNEAVLGHDLNRDDRPEVLRDLERARRSGLHSLTGPLQLRQGGLGLVARRAITRDGRFWGFVTLVLDVSAIIPEGIARPHKTEFALRDSQGRVFYGNAHVFHADPVVERVPLPDGYWEVAAIPPGGWAAMPRAAIEVYRWLTLSLLLVIGAVVYLITERQCRLSRAVRESEWQYRLVTDSVPMLVESFDEQGRCRFANTAHQRWFGRPREQLIGQTVAGILGQDVAAKVEQARVGVRARGPVAFDAEVQVQNLGARQVHATFVARQAEDASADGFILVLADITHRKQAEQAVRRSEARLARAQAIAHVGSWELDVATGEIQCSDEALRILDLEWGPQTKLCRDDISARIPEAERQRVDSAIQQGLITGTVETEHQVRHRSGAVRIVHMRAELERVGGVPARFAGTVQDVTDYRDLEAQFRQAQKMEAIGRLAGGVAHDFNNLLSVILGYSEMALEGGQSEAEWKEGIEEIRHATERAARLTRQLLAFSRQQVLQPRVLNLNTVVAEVQKLLGRIIGENIELRTHLAPSIGNVLVDAGQMEQVILNLAVNARDAMPEGGVLTIETAEEETAAGRHVVLRIRDTGTGIPPEIQPRIFDPFFTTKETGKGTGLGLSTVYGIVRQSGGEIAVSSEPGQGATFVISLPVSEQPAAAEATQRSPFPPRPGSETVLLVEDDGALRSYAELLLGRLHYQVLAAADAAQALRALEAHAGPVHLLLTDVIMPGMNGPDLARQVRALRPDVKVLYMSGYVDSGVVDPALLGDGAGFLQKPFTVESFCRALRTVLDQAAAEEESTGGSAG